MNSALPKNILVADPDESRGLHTALVIKRLEYNVFAVANGDDLLRIANRIIPQLILLDLRMPLSGMENCLDMLRSDSLFRMMRMIFKVLLHAGTAIRLTLELPSESPLTLEGEVIYSRAHEKDAFMEPGMGIKFVNLTDKLKKELKNFIEDQLSVDIDRETLI